MPWIWGTPENLNGLWIGISPQERSPSRKSEPLWSRSHERRQIFRAHYLAEDWLELCRLDSVCFASRSLTLFFNNMVLGTELVNLTRGGQGRVLLIFETLWSLLITFQHDGAWNAIDELHSFFLSVFPRHLPLSLPRHAFSNDGHRSVWRGQIWKWWDQKLGVIDKGGEPKVLENDVVD